MPAFEWVHVQLHQQKGMISLSPPTICNSAILTGCLSEAENLVILFFDVVTGMPSRKSHLLPAAVSSLESVTASFGSKVEVWLAPR
ncbi:hypothetical protein KLQUMA044M3_25885 [Klebsiella quasipneumoniae subsp. similipneumoniae]